MIKLQFFNGTKWIECGQFVSEFSAWSSLGNDNINYRTVNEQGVILRTTQVEQAVRGIAEKGKEA